MDEADLSQADLAQLTGAAQASISRWAHAKSRPSYDILRKLVDILIGRYPKLGDRPTQLLTAAGYEDGYMPAEIDEAEEVRRAAARIEDEARRRRVESIVDRSLRDMEEDQKRRLRQLREIIGLAEDESE